MQFRGPGQWIQGLEQMEDAGQKGAAFGMYFDQGEETTVFDAAAILSEARLLGLSTAAIFCPAGVMCVCRLVIRDEGRQG